MKSDISLFQVTPEFIGSVNESSLYDRTIDIFGQGDEWLLEDRNKFRISSYCYDFIQVRAKHVIEVGSGLNRFIPSISSKVDYTILDPLYSYQPVQASRMENYGVEVIQQDWYGINTAKFKNKSLICMDLFPNVDQRVERFLNICQCSQNFIITLTINDSGKFYPCKRLDGDEVMTVSPWTSQMMNNLFYAKGLPTINIQKTNLFDNAREILVLQKG